MGSYYNIPQHDQRFEEYTKENSRIQYDYEGNEISRCDFDATNSIVTIFGKEINGNEWSFSYDYWINHDSLSIKHSGGFEFYMEYFIRVK